MKVAVLTQRNSAPRRALIPLYPHWKRVGIDVVEIESWDPKETFTDFDIVHMAVASPMEEWNPSVPCTINIWQIPIRGTYHAVHVYERFLQQHYFDRIFVDDGMTLQILGQLGVTRVTRAPMVIDPSLLPRLLPNEEKRFSAGTFCLVSAGKRVGAMDAACQIVGVEFLPFVSFPDAQNGFFLDPPRDVYSRMHVYLHASFLDTSSLPALEALACGRPIISTYNEGMSRVIREGENGLFTDGSPEDIAACISRIRENYNHYVLHCQETTVFPLPRRTAEIYVDVWKELLK